MANEKDWQQDISTTVDTHTTTIADHEERITANKVKLDDHETRIDNIETTSDVGQFATRIQAIEAKNTEQDGKLDTLEADNTSNKSRLDSIEAKNTEQDGKLDTLEADNTSNKSRLDNIEAKNTEQDGKLTTLSQKTSDFVTPQMFGAIGNANYYNEADGKFYEDSTYSIRAHDDTEAFKQAISTGNNICIPKGRYLISDTLEISRHVNIWGVGIDSILYFVSDSVLTAIHVTGKFKEYPYDYLRNISIKNLYIDITHLADSEDRVGLFVEYAHSNVFENISVVQNNSQTGMFFGSGVMTSTINRLSTHSIKIGYNTDDQFRLTSLCFISLYAHKINLKNADTVTFISPTVEGTVDGKITVEFCRCIRFYGGHFEGTGLLYKFIGTNNRWFYSLNNGMYAYQGTYTSGTLPYRNLFSDGNQEFIVNGYDIDVIESGANYIRYNDGRYICWGTAIASSGIATFTYPSAFIERPVAVTSIVNNGYISNLNNTTTTYCTANCFGISNGTLGATQDPCTVNFLIVGRWKY